METLDCRKKENERKYQITKQSSCSAHGAQQQDGAAQAQSDNNAGQRQVELRHAGHGKAGVDGKGQHAQGGANAGKQARAWRVEQHMAVAGQHDGNRGKVECQIALHAAWQVEHFPFVPVGGIDLVQNQKQQGPKIRSRHGVFRSGEAVIVCEAARARKTAPAKNLHIKSCLKQHTVPIVRQSCLPLLPTGPYDYANRQPGCRFPAASV